MLDATPDSVQEKLRPWCYVSPINTSSASILDGRVYDFANLSAPVYECTDSTSIEGQDHRILVTLESWISYNETEVSGFMCEPKYSLTSRVVTNITRDIRVDDDLNISGATINTLDMGISPFNMTQKIFDSLGTSFFEDMVHPELIVWFTLLNVT